MFRIADLRNADSQNSGLELSQDLGLPSQPQGVGALWLLASYIAWQRHTGVSSWSKATAQWCPGRTQTSNLWITSPMPPSIVPPHHQILQ